MKILIGVAAAVTGLLVGCGGATAPVESESRTTITPASAAGAPPQLEASQEAARILEEARARMAGRGAPGSAPPGSAAPGSTTLGSASMGRPAPWAEPSRGGQWLLRAPAPPKVVAQRRSDISEAVRDAANARRNAGANPRRGERWVDSARIGLLQGAPEGGQFLNAPQTRALARGEPAESCPAISVASGRTIDQAVRTALDRCFAALDGRPDCGCRLMAQGSQLLAREGDFAYATGVTAVMNGRDYNGALMIAEERPDPASPWDRRVWLLSTTGVAAMAQLASDGRAALVFAQTGARYDGTHRAEGLRRGRVARRLFLRGADGDRLTILVGFEPAELAERGAELRVWEDL